jgi:drug/metabolite transporter (DMT)-like permease
VAVLVMVVWGATPVLTRIATEDMQPLMVAVLRTVLAGALAAPILAATRVAPPTAGRARALLAISAAAGFVVFPVVYTIGQERTSAMHGVGILAALPVFTGIYAAIVARRRPGPWWLVGCAIALLGETVIVVVRTGGDAGEATLAGDLLVLAAALVVSAGYVAGALLVPRGFSSAATTYWGVTLGALVLAPLGAGLLATDGLPEAGASEWLAVLFLAVVTSIVGYVGWYWALAHGGIGRIAPLQFLQPLSGLVLAALVLDERLTPSLAIGAAAVIAGVTLTLRDRAAPGRDGPSTLKPATPES